MRLGASGGPSGPAAAAPRCHAPLPARNAPATEGRGRHKRPDFNGASGHPVGAKKGYSQASATSPNCVKLFAGFSCKTVRLSRRYLGITRVRGSQRRPHAGRYRPGVPAGRSTGCSGITQHARGTALPLVCMPPKEVTHSRPTGQRVRAFLHDLISAHSFKSQSDHHTCVNYS